MKQRVLSENEVKEKIRRYCVYQKRCASEVKSKLFSLGIKLNEADVFISDLINSDYLHEDEFAKAFAQGRFRIKKWGKQKIKQALRQKNIDESIIKKSLAFIDNNEYKQIFYTLADKKLNQLSSVKNNLIKKRKLFDYLMQKGFETQLIQEYVKGL